MNDTGRADLKFYDANAPNPKVVRMFAAEKSMSLDIVDVDVMGGENRRAPYNTEVNRTGQVPALVLDSGQVITEVLPICEYLEEVAPTPALVGSTPEERAETRMWTRWIDLKYAERMSEACIVMPGPIREHYAEANPVMLPEEVGDTLAKIARYRLSWLDSEMTGRKFICGDRFTLADIHFWVFLEFFEKLGLPYPSDANWIDGFYQRVSERPSTSA